MTEVTASLETRQALDELASQVIVACDSVLARVWLLGPGDECASCAMRTECPSQIRCLHLAASAGVSTRIDGAFRRFPLGAREVGHTAVTGRPFVLASRLAEAGIAEASWLGSHRVQSFAAVPLVSGPRILGVLALFSRRALSDDEVRLLDLAASQAARAVEALARPKSHAKRTGPAESSSSVEPAPRAAEEEMRGTDGSLEVPTLAETQRRAIARALAAAEGRVSGPGGAAERLGLHPNTLISRMIRLGMRRRSRRSGPARR